MKTEKELLELKRQVDTAKTEVSELEGQRKAQLKQLMDDWGCKTVEEAEKKLSAMRKEIDTLTKQIESGIKDLEENYNV